MSNQFEDLEVRYAYDSIKDFFDHYDMEYALKWMEDILSEANSTRHWKKDAPYNLLFFMQQVEKLVAAALLIHHSYSRRSCCILSDEKEALEETDFILRKEYETLWSSFPRQLSRKQYNNPYKAVKKFAKQPGWKKALEEITEYALSNGTIGDIHPPYNILNLRHHLLRLIEACHLLLVRSNHNPKTK